MRFYITILSLLMSGFIFGQSLSSQPTMVTKAFKFDKSQPLRNITPYPPGTGIRDWKSKGVPNKEGMKQFRDRKENALPIGDDPAWQKVMGTMPLETPSVNFEGVGNIHGYYPPDTQGDVGPSHYVQITNVSFAIFDKSGNTLYGPADNITIWDGFIGDWSSTNDGDGIVLYDQGTDRWLFSQFALPFYPNGPFYQLVAISETGDPTGAWYRYAFQFDKFPDYPKFGVWPDAYYMTINQFTSDFAGVGAVAFERDKMVMGDSTARMIYFDVPTLPNGSDPESMLPSDWDGATPPPAGTPNYFTYFNDDALGYPTDHLRVWEFHVDWTTTSNSTFTQVSILDTDPFDSEICSAYRNQCIDQPSGAPMLESLQDRLMYRLQYRNFGTYQAMVTNHSVDVGADLGGIRWYELRNTGSGWSIYQQGTYSVDSDHRWMGSVAMDGAGNIALGYSVSSTSTFPSIRFTGRPASAPLGQMTFIEEEIVAGSGVQTGSAARWGDYSMMSVDPVDDATFWYTQEYVQSTGSTNWQTRIAAFTFEEDSIAPSAITDLQVLSATSNSLTLQWTSTGDDSSTGTAYTYDLRYSTAGPVTELNWDAAAQALNLPSPQAPGNTESYTLENLEIGTTYYFAIKAYDNLLNPSPISNGANDATYGPPSIAVTPANITHIVEPDSALSDSIMVANNSGNTSTLDFSIELMNNTFPEGSVSLNGVPNKIATDEVDNLGKNKNKFRQGMSFTEGGGPDTFGYEWIDSDDPGGPVYEWNDISSTGSTASWSPTGTFDPKDEGYAGPYNLGFTFKFYGIDYTQVYFSSNGFVTIAPITENTFTNDQIPNADVPNGFIAPVWDDLDGTSSGDVFYQQDGNRFIIQYENWGEFTGTGTYTFQVVLYSNGKILVYYKSLTGDLDQATVGIENPDGTDGLQVAYNSVYLKNNHAVKYSAEPEWLLYNSPSGLLYNGNTVSVGLDFITSDLTEGTYTMDFVVNSNDPANAVVTIPIEMTIDSQIPVELVSFTADYSGSNVTLNWSTATETNNDGFEIQRKIISDKINSEWKTAGFIKGNGTTAKISNYQFLDNLENVEGQKIKYRLKQINLDGTSEYSNTVELLVLPNEFVLEQNYPNPFNPATTIKYGLPEDGNVKIRVFNVLGEMVTELVNQVQTAGYHEIVWNAANVSSGIYLYRMEVGNGGEEFNSVKRMLLLK